MKIEAHYYHKNYNAFEEIESKRGKTPYKIATDIPDILTNDDIRKEANKPTALKDGYYLKDLFKVEWNGMCWKYNKI